jgi:hypothetical protein
MIRTAVAASAILLAGVSLQSQSPANGPAARSVSADVRAALFDALAGEDGEYAERARYSAIVEKFGQVQPYASIRISEGHHAAAIEAQLKKHGIALPEDRYAGKTHSPATLGEAALECIRAEERNMVLCERLLTRVSPHPELSRILRNLQRSSREGHLAALKAAAANGGKLTPEQMRTFVWRGRRQSAGGSGTPN